MRVEDALQLWTTTKPYCSFPCSTIAWRLTPAIENDKARLFYRNGGCVGLITWAFMTSQEFETRDYCGPEIFARENGERLVVVDLIAPYGRKDVVWICKEMRKQFWDEHPWIETVYAHRGKRSGLFPNAGVWHENIS